MKLNIKNIRFPEGLRVFRKNAKHYFSFALSKTINFIKNRPHLRDVTPKSLFGRTLLIVLIPTILVQVVATYIFYDRHWGSITRNMSVSVAGEIAATIKWVEEKKGKERQLMLKTSRELLGIRAIFRESAELSKKAEKYPRRFRILERELQKRIDYPFVIFESEDSDLIVVEADINKKIYQFQFTSKKLMNPTTYIFIMWMFGSATILLIIAVLFLRNQVKPIIKLAEAAEAFGKGQDIENFKPRGAEEVRKAAEAFIKMRERIKKQIRQRTEMLAGISHDLRTPLTRMRLQLELIKDSLAAKGMREDIDEMEKMIGEYLNFARGEKSEDTADISIRALFNLLSHNYKNYKTRLKFNIENKNDVINIRVNSLKRALNNLIDNSLKYAKNTEVSAYHENKEIIIKIDDDGPGIPVKIREDVFKPFFRIETSRNKETGGVGLGLSIARDAVRAHGGDISLDKSDMGGLKVTIKIPA